MESIKSNPLVWIAGALLAALFIGYLLQARMAGSPVASDGPNGTGTSTSTTTPSVEGGDRTTTANMYLVATGDAGKLGRKIGCDDSLVAVPATVSAIRPLTEVLNQLFALKTQTYGETGLYHSLYQSNIKLDSAVIENGNAILTLSGTTQLSGACDTPRVIEQIRETALQFPSVTSVSILLNGAPIETALSEQ